MFKQIETMLGIVLFYIFLLLFFVFISSCLFPFPYLSFPTLSFSLKSGEKKKVDPAGYLRNKLFELRE